MTKINNDSVSQCLLHCLKQTKLKYGEALVHSSGLSKHGTFLMWKITKIRKICPFSFSQKFCITPFIKGRNSGASQKILWEQVVTCSAHSKEHFKTNLAEYWRRGGGAR